MEDNELFNSTPFPASVKAIREDKQIMMRSSSVGNNMTDILKTNEKKRNIVFNASKVEDLPKDLKKMCRASRISDSAFENNWALLMNILHFLTSKVFVHPIATSNDSKKIIDAEKLKSPVIKLKTKAPDPKKLFKSMKKNGRGGFGTVYVAKEIAANNAKCAIKRMKHVTIRQRMDNEDEAKYMKICANHPNIVQFRTTHETKDEFWVVMEYLEGGTLTEARRGHEFEEFEIAFVAKELLKAIEYVHSKGLVHRDVKSENIMLSIQGDVKLIDFGLCIDNSINTRPSMVGSPYWMPPEMICGKVYSYPVDIWSFGISICELANKNPPNSGDKLRAMFTTATDGISRPLEDSQKWSSNFRNFISRCLECDPAKRGTASELLLHPFLEQASDTKVVMRKILSEIFIQRAIGLI